MKLNRFRYLKIIIIFIFSGIFLSFAGLKSFADELNTDFINKKCKAFEEQIFCAKSPDSALIKKLKELKASEYICEQYKEDPLYYLLAETGSKNDKIVKYCKRSPLTLVFYLGQGVILLFFLIFLVKISRKIKEERNKNAS